jgi:hypothetical protein
MSFIAPAANMVSYAPPVTKFVSAIGNGESTFALGLRDLADSFGRIGMAGRRSKLEQNEQRINELATASVWSVGVPAAKAGYDAVAKHFLSNPHLNLDVLDKGSLWNLEETLGNRTVQQAIGENALQELKQVSQPALKHLYERNANIKLVVMTTIPAFIVGFVVPKIYQKMTKEILIKQKKEALEAQQAEKRQQQMASQRKMIAMSQAFWPAMVAATRPVVSAFQQPAMFAAQPFAAAAPAAQQLAYRAAPGLTVAPMMAAAAALPMMGSHHVAETQAASPAQPQHPQTRFGNLLHNGVQAIMKNDRLATLLGVDTILSGGRVATSRNLPESLENLGKESIIIFNIYALPGLVEKAAAKPISNFFGGVPVQMTPNALAYFKKYVGQNHQAVGQTRKLLENALNIGPSQPHRNLSEFLERVNGLQEKIQAGSGFLHDLRPDPVKAQAAEAAEKELTQLLAPLRDDMLRYFQACSQPAEKNPLAVLGKFFSQPECWAEKAAQAGQKVSANHAFEAMRAGHMIPLRNFNGRQFIDVAQGVSQNKIVDFLHFFNEMDRAVAKKAGPEAGKALERFVDRAMHGQMAVQLAANGTGFLVAAIALPLIIQTATKLITGQQGYPGGWTAEQQAEEELKAAGLVDDLDASLPTPAAASASASVPTSIATPASMPVAQASIPVIEIATHPTTIASARLPMTASAVASPSAFLSAPVVRPAFSGRMSGEALPVSRPGGVFSVAG